MAFGKAGKASGLLVKLMMDTSDFDKKSIKSKKELKSFKTVMVGLATATAGLTAGLGGIAAGFAAVSRTGTELQDTMVRANALLGEKGTTGTFKMLKDAAVEFGSTTEFTANQAGQAMQEFAKQGLTAQQAISATSAALAVATVGATDMGSASDFVGTTLKQFSMSADQAGNVADTLAVALTNTRADFTSLRSAMVYAGPAARAFGLDMDEAVAASAAFIEIGLDGTLAGNAFKMAMQKLQKPTQSASRALKEAGLSVADITPNMIGANGEVTTFQDTVERLAEASNITGQDIVEIFGARAGSPMTVLIEQVRSGVNTVDRLSSALADKDGLAGRMREQMLNSIAGTSVLISSAVDGAMQSLFDTFGGVDGAFHTLLKEVLQFVNQVGDAIKDRADEFERAFSAAAGELQTAFGDSRSSAEMLADVILDIAVASAGLARVVRVISGDVSMFPGWLQTIFGILKTINAVVTFPLRIFKAIKEEVLGVGDGMKDLSLELNNYLRLAGIRSFNGLSDEQLKIATEARKIGVAWNKIGEYILDAEGNLVRVKKAAEGISNVRVETDLVEVFDDKGNIVGWKTVAEIREESAAKLAEDEQKRREQQKKDAARRKQDAKDAEAAAEAKRARETKHSAMMYAFSQEEISIRRTLQEGSFEFQNSMTNLKHRMHEEEMARIDEQLKHGEITAAQATLMKQKSMDSYSNYVLDMINRMEIAEQEKNERLAKARMELDQQREDFRISQMQEGLGKELAIIDRTYRAEEAALRDTYKDQPKILDQLIELMNQRRKVAEDTARAENMTTKEIRAQARAQLKSAKVSGDKAGMQQAKQTLKDTGTSFSEKVFPKLDAGIKNFKAQVADKGFFQAAGGMVGSALSAGIGMAVEAAKKFVSAVGFDKVFDFASMVGDASVMMDEGVSAEDAGNSAAEKVVSNVMRQVDAWVNALPFIINKVAESLPILIKKVVSAIPMLITAVLQYFPVIVEELVKAIPLIVEAILKMLPKILVAVFKFVFTQLPKIILQLVAGIFKAVVDAIRQAFGKRDQEYKDEKKELKSRLNSGEISRQQYEMMLSQAKEDYEARRENRKGDGSFYSGINYVPRNMKGVTLHKGERVVPAHENRPGYAEGGGMSSPSAYGKGSGSHGQSSFVANMVLDGQVVDRAVMRAGKDGRGGEVKRMVRRSSGRLAGISSRER